MSEYSAFDLHVRPYEARAKLLVSIEQQSDTIQLLVYHLSSFIPFMLLFQPHQPPPQPMGIYLAAAQGRRPWLQVSL